MKGYNEFLILIRFFMAFGIFISIFIGIGFCNCPVSDFYFLLILKIIPGLKKLI